MSAEAETNDLGSDFVPEHKTSSLRVEWDAFNHDAAHATSYLHLCVRAIDVGESLLAYDIARKGLDAFPENKLLTQKAGLSLKNAGSPLKASNILENLLEKHHDVETYSLLASCYKDLWGYASDPSKKSEYAGLAIDYYKKGLAATSLGTLKSSRRGDKQYYPCINVAFLYFVALRNYKEAREYAQQALKICQELIHASESDYWVLATAAEAQLIYGHLDDAIKAYQVAVAFKGATPAQIASTCSQAMKIAELYDARDKLAKIFPMAGVVAFSGHMIDKPGSAPRFPPQAEEVVREEIEKALERLGASFGYSSAACGADLLFIECMLARGGEVHVFLPFNKNDFIEASVRYAGEQWVERFEAVLSSAATTMHYVTDGGYLGEDELFSLCNEVFAGFASMHSRRLAENPHLLTVWDGGDGGLGGTGTLIERWRTSFGEPIRIDTNHLLQELPPPLPDEQASRGVSPQAEAHPVRREVKTMLFADVEGFSKLPDEKNPAYAEHFLGGIAKILESLSKPPRFINTWGDSIFAVFDHLSDGLNMALDLRDFVVRTNWEEKGLPTEFSARISLHAGPAYSIEDPLLGKTNFFGRHVNNAARIEPIALPGCVYVSETVAALLTFRGHDFDFEYVGNVELAKSFGSFPIYLLQRPGYIDY
ncbi:MAG: tetratricopeptide repeat-containing protein [Opitutales bacterium]